MSERGLRKTNAVVAAVVHRVESLQPGHAVDEVKALTTWCTNIRYDEINSVEVSAKQKVQIPL